MADYWVERTHERELLKWCDDKSSQLWWIEADGGLGKTVLLSKFKEIAEQKKVPVVLMEAVPSTFSEALHKIDDGISSAKELLKIKAKAFSFENARYLKAKKETSNVSEGLSNDDDNASLEALSSPEQFLIRSLKKDFQNGGILLIDDWQHISHRQVTTFETYDKDHGWKQIDNATQYSIADKMAQYLTDLFEAPIVVIIAGRTSGWPTDTINLSDDLTVQNYTISPFSESESKELLKTTSLISENAIDDFSEQLYEVSKGHPLITRRLQEYLSTKSKINLSEEFDALNKYGEKSKIPRLAIHAKLIEYLVNQNLESEDKYFWRLALPKELPADIFTEIFYDMGATTPFKNSNEAIEHYCKIGLLKKHVTNSYYKIHDLDRQAILHWCKETGILPYGEGAEIHAFISSYYGTKAKKIPKIDEAQSEKLYLAAAEYGVKSVNFEKKEFTPYSAIQFWAQLYGSISLTGFEKYKVAEALPNLSLDQVKELDNIFNEELNRFIEMSEDFSEHVAELMLERSTGNVELAKEMFSQYLSKYKASWQLTLASIINNTQPKDERLEKALDTLNDDDFPNPGKLKITKWLLKTFLEKNYDSRYMSIIEEKLKESGVVVPSNISPLIQIVTKALDKFMEAEDLTVHDRASCAYLLIDKCNQPILGLNALRVLNENNPDDLSAVLTLAYALSDHNPDEAINLLQGFIEEFPDTENIEGAFLQIHSFQKIKLRDFEAAGETLRQALKLKPKDPSLLRINALNLSEHSNNNKKVADAFELAIRFNQEDAYLHEQYSYFLTNRLGEYIRASYFLDRSLDLSPVKTAAARLSKVELLIVLDEKKEALELIQSIEKEELEPRYILVKQWLKACIVPEEDYSEVHDGIVVNLNDGIRHSNWVFKVVTEWLSETDHPHSEVLTQLAETICLES